jgi:protein SCO1/2
MSKQSIKNVLQILTWGVFTWSVYSHNAIAVADPLADKFGGAFSLQSAGGNRVSDKDFRGRFMLVYFGFTHCPDICPTELSEITSALDALGEQGEIVQPIFITVDPARDTPEALDAYSKSFHPRLLMLTGTEAEIAAVAKVYKVHRRKYLWRQEPQNSRDYGIDHGSLIYLMGPDGKFRTLFPLGTTSEKMTETIRKYIAADKLIGN